MNRSELKPKMPLWQYAKEKREREGTTAPTLRSRVSIERGGFNRNPEPKPDRVSAHQHVDPKDQRESEATCHGRADRLAGQSCRDRGVCEAAVDGHKCGGGFQWCHVFGRDDKTVRWDPLAALCMCADRHKFYTDNPAEWGKFLIKHKPGLFHVLMERRVQHGGGLQTREEADGWSAYYRAKRTNPNAPKPSFAVVWEAVK